MIFLQYIMQPYSEPPWTSQKNSRRNSQQSLSGPCRADCTFGRVWRQQSQHAVAIEHRYITERIRHRTELLLCVHKQRGTVICLHASGLFFVTVHWRVTTAYAVLYCSLLQTITTILTHLSSLVASITIHQLSRRGARLQHLITHHSHALFLWQGHSVLSQHIKNPPHWAANRVLAH